MFSYAQLQSNLFLFSSKARMLWTLLRFMQLGADLNYITVISHGIRNSVIRPSNSNLCKNCSTSSRLQAENSRRWHLVFRYTPRILGDSSAVLHSKNSQRNWGSMGYLPMKLSNLIIFKINPIIYQTVAYFPYILVFFIKYSGNK